MLHLKKPRLSFILIAVTLLISVLYQAVDAGEKKHGGKKHEWKKHGQKIGIISGGISFLDLDELNDELDAMGIDEFEEYAPVLKLSHHMVIKRIISIGEGNILFWRNGYGRGYETNLLGFSLMHHLGVNVLPEKNPVRIYPTFGLGWGVLKFDIYESKRSFSSAVTSEGFNNVFWQHTFLLSVGAGVDYTYKLPWHKKKKKVVGIRAGYTFDVVDNDNWFQKDGTEIIDSPDPRMSGAYVVLILGKEKRHHYHAKGKHKGECCMKGKKCCMKEKKK